MERYHPEKPNTLLKKAAFPEKQLP